MLAYLPKLVAFNTLNDFMIVLRMGVVTAPSHERPQKVDEIKFDTEMILARLDAVKKQVEETQAMQNKLLMPVVNSVQATSAPSKPIQKGQPATVS